MPRQIKIWEIIQDDNLKELEKSKLNLEKRLEGWLENDISIISKDLLTIGTHFSR